MKEIINIVLTNNIKVHNQRQRKKGRNSKT